MKTLLPIIGLFCGLSTNALAIQTSISVQGDGPLGDLVGTMSYDDISPGAGELTFKLTNTSSPDNGGYLTAFVFNLPAGARFSSFEFSSVVESAAFQAILDDGSSKSPTKAEPYGTFDLGAASTKSFLGGGSPTSGLPVGASGVFTFSFQGSGLNSLTVDSFIEAGTSLATFDGGAFFVARFRGFDDGGSNKTPSNAVPDPSTTLGLFAVSLLALMLCAVRQDRFVRVPARRRSP